MTDCQHCDALVVDWLYDQLEAPLYERFRAHLSASASCRQQVESLAQTRALIATLPSEEPSPALIQKLIHHAQKQARSRHARLLTWLSSLAELTWAPPASAALASLVLVAGIAGSRYVSGRTTLSAPHGEASRAAESVSATSAAAPSAPSAQTEASATAPSRTPVADEREQKAQTPRPQHLDRAKANPTSSESARAEGRRVDFAQADPAIDSDGDSANDSPAPVSTPADNQNLAPGARAGGRSQGSLLAPPPPPEATARDQAPASPRQRATRGARQSGAGRYAQPAVPVGGVEAQGDDNDTSRDAPLDTSGALANSKRPRPSEPSPDRERSSGGSQTQSPERSDKRSPSTEDETPSLSATRTQLTRALAANKCRPALALAKTVRDRDRDYYRQHLANNRQLTRCQQRVARERARRAKPSGKANREADQRPEREAAQEATEETQ